MPKPLHLFVSCMLIVTSVAWAATATIPDFSGIWRLNDQQSDSPDAIASSLRTERKREEAAAQLPASASSIGTPATTTTHSHNGRGGGHGMGRSGGGHGGKRDQNKPGSSEGTSPIVDTPPPLLASDSILNVQQDARHIKIALSDSDQLNVRLDGIAQQSLNGNAVVQTHGYSDGVVLSMQFDGGTHLDEFWVKSADGHHLTVTEQWTTPNVKQPIVFKRRYDRLDI